MGDHTPDDTTYSESSADLEKRVATLIDERDQLNRTIEDLINRRIEVEKGASSETKDAPVPEYRVLREGDIIAKDDEFLTDDCETWELVGNLLGRDCPYVPGFYRPMRRRIAKGGGDEIR